MRYIFILLLAGCGPDWKVPIDHWSRAPEVTPVDACERYFLLLEIREGGCGDIEEKQQVAIDACEQLDLSNVTLTCIESLRSCIYLDYGCTVKWDKSLCFSGCPNQQQPWK